MNILSKLKTGVWFLLRPKLWGQAWVLLLRKFEPNLDTPSHRANATAWCQTNAKDTQQVLTELAQQLGVYVPTTTPNGFTAFEEVVGPEAWQQANQRAAACPVRMGGAGNLTLLYHCCELTQAQWVQETGVAYGWSSYALLQSLHNRPNAWLASTDMPYAQLNNDAWVGTVVPKTLAKQWLLFRQADRQALPAALKTLAQKQAQLGGSSFRLDVCHYDSDKSYSGRKWAYPLLWKALRPGGLFISDDINDNEYFRHFAEAHKLPFWVVAQEDKYIGVIVKPTE